MGNVGRHYYRWRYADFHAADVSASYDVKITVGPAPVRATHVEESMQFTNNTGQSLDRAVLHAPWHNWEGVLTLASVSAQGRQAQARWREGINLELTFARPL